MNGNNYNFSNIMKTILITGGNGFLGSNIVKSLIKNYKIIVLVRNTEKLFRLNSFLPKLKIYSTITDDLESIFKDNSIDIILHTATVYGRNEETLNELLSTNLLLPLNLLQLGIQYNVSTFINTDTVLKSNTNPYALSKSQLRNWLVIKSDKIKVINIQLEHFYGPGGSIDNFISWIILKFVENEIEIDLTKGEQQRDFLYIDDVVSAFSTIINNLDLLIDNYVEIQVASNEVISIKDLVQLLKNLTGSKTILNFGALPYRPNELMQLTTNNDKIKSLGWFPIISLEEGMKRTIKYIKNQSF